MKKRGSIKRNSKKAQIMGMPFQFIFAIILVAVVLFVGFFVIKMFLERVEQAKINDFVKNQLEYEIQAIWSGPEESSITKSFILSKNFDYVCFMNQDRTKPCNSAIAPPDFCNQNTGYRMWTSSNKDNLFFVPLGKAEKYDSHTANYIKCGTKDCITWKDTNPLCIPVVNGKVSIKFEKSSGSPNVTISQG